MMVMMMMRHDEPGTISGGGEISSVGEGNEEEDVIRLLAGESGAVV